mmetsp:Transcript_30854/g.69290  ORF Transcript_30854/g.69290 Transcript_30854/m.69290 type:complete len:272 (+) Transcript_30854:228-1043(+)
MPSVSSLAPSLSSAVSTSFRGRKSLSKLRPSLFPSRNGPLGSLIDFSPDCCLLSFSLGRSTAGDRAVSIFSVEVSVCLFVSSEGPFFVSYLSGLDVMSSPVIFGPLESAAGIVWGLFSLTKATWPSLSLLEVKLASTVLPIPVSPVNPANGLFGGPGKASVSPVNPANGFEAFFTVPGLSFFAVRPLKPTKGLVCLPSSLSTEGGMAPNLDLTTPSRFTLTIRRFAIISAGAFLNVPDSEHSLSSSRSTCRGGRRLCHRGLAYSIPNAISQ